MALVTRGRLSVQRVEEQTYEILVQMGERGGWDEAATKPAKASGSKDMKKKAAARKGGRKVRKDELNDGDDDDVKEETEKMKSSAEITEDPKPGKKGRGTKRKAKNEDEYESQPVRRSTRTKR